MWFRRCALSSKCRQGISGLRKAFKLSQLIHVIDERSISSACHVIRVATNQILNVINGRSLLFSVETFGVHGKCARLYWSVGTGTVGIVGIKIQERLHFAEMRILVCWNLLSSTV